MVGAYSASERPAAVGRSSTSASPAGRGVGTPVPAETTAPAPMDGPPDLALVMAKAEEVGMTLVAPAEA